MMHTFSYKSGYVHEAIDPVAGEHVHWQCGRHHGYARSVPAAKAAITRAERRRAAHTRRLAEIARERGLLGPAAHLESLENHDPTGNLVPIEDQIAAMEHQIGGEGSPD